MPGRDPEAADRSARVAHRIRTEMRRQGLSGLDLRVRIEKLRGQPVADNERNARVWMSRRMTGKVNLIQPVKVIYGPTEDLAIIARALGVDPHTLVNAIDNTTASPEPTNTTTV